MGLTETEAIVLRTYNLAEADKIVVCLTRKYGVVRVVAKGARKLKSRFGAGLEPFTLIALGYFEKEGRELASLKQAEIVRSYFKLAHDTEVFGVLSYFSELVMEFAPPREPNENLYRMVRACLEAIDTAPDSLPLMARYFEVWILRLAGFLPDIRVCAGCGLRLGGAKTVYFNIDFKPRCADCSQGQGGALSGTAYRQLLEIQRLSPQKFAQAARHLDPSILNDLAMMLRRLIERVLERAPRVRAAVGRNGTGAEVLKDSVHQGRQGIR
jgi:DNA repair protein RecO (recombination protein O)